MAKTKHYTKKYGLQKRAITVQLIFRLPWLVRTHDQRFPRSDSDLSTMIASMLQRAHFFANIFCNRTIEFRISNETASRFTFVG